MVGATDPVFPDQIWQLLRANFFLYESQEPSENQVELIESKLQNED